MAAATFAEAGEHGTALRIMGARKPAASLWKGAFDRITMAATFAEADCHDMARDFLKTPSSRKSGGGRNTSLDEFIKAVGLERARYTYGLASF
jgi:hypothetical protein